METKTKNVMVMLCIIRICKECERRNGRHGRKKNNKDSDNTSLVEIPLKGMPDCTSETIEAMKREGKDFIFTLYENGVWICPSCKRNMTGNLPFNEIN